MLKTRYVVLDLETVNYVSRNVADLAPRLDDLLEVIARWNQDAQSASSTSPRWEKAREMLRDINHVIRGQYD